MGDASVGTRECLIRAAETLMARHGIGAVTTQDILARAGQRNRSALHYHFGSREGLIQAALVAQMRRVDARRAQLLYKAGTRDAAGLARAFVLPVAEDILTEEHGRDNLSLLSQYIHSPNNDFEGMVRKTQLPGISRAMDRIWEVMPSLPSQIQHLRYRTAFSAALAALLSWSEQGARHPAEFTEDLIDTTALILSSTPAARHSVW